MTKIAMVLLIAGLALSINGCDSTQASVNDYSEDPMAYAVAVATEAAVVGDVFAHYAATATLEALSEAPAVAKVGGEIKTILIEEGDLIRAGQVLARLDSRELRLNVVKASANVKRLAQQHKRNQRLYQHQLISEGEIENLKFELQASQSELELAKLQLGYSEIRAPIKGIVAARHIKVGNTLSVGDVAFEITDVSRLRAEVRVPQDELLRLKAGQTVDLSFDARPDQRFDGVVQRVSPTVDSKTGTARITVAVSDPGKHLRPGMFGRFNIVYAQHAGAVLIPIDSLIREDTQITVFVIEDGIAHRRAIETGFINQDRVEVVKGITAGEQVVTLGQLGLRDGSLVSQQNLELATYTL